MTTATLDARAYLVAWGNTALRHANTSPDEITKACSYLRRWGNAADYALAGMIITERTPQ